MELLIKNGRLKFLVQCLQEDFISFEGLRIQNRIK